MSTVQTQKLAHPNDTNAATIGTNGVVDFDSMPTVNGGALVTSVSGEIIQTKVTKVVPRNDHIGTSSSTSASTGVSVTITPQYSNSKILIEVNATMAYGRASQYLCWELHRARSGYSADWLSRVTTNYNTDYYHGWVYNSTGQWTSMSATEVDTTHGTTNSITYTLYHRHYNNGGSNSYTAHRGAAVVMKATEIKA